MAKHKHILLTSHPDTSGKKKFPCSGERVPIPDDLVPEDAQVEIALKKVAVYYINGVVPNENVLSEIKGRELS